MGQRINSGSLPVGMMTRNREIREEGRTRINNVEIDRGLIAHGATELLQPTVGVETDAIGGLITNGLHLIDLEEEMRKEKKGGEGDLAEQRVGEVGCREIRHTLSKSTCFTSAPNQSF